MQPEFMVVVASPQQDADTATPLLILAWRTSQTQLQRVSSPRPHLQPHKSPSSHFAFKHSKTPFYSFTPLFLSLVNLSLGSNESLCLLRLPLATHIYIPTSQQPCLQLLSVN